MTGPQQLVAGLMRPEAWPHPVATVRLQETHISWVFLTGEYAYKVKKPVRLDFLDFSTLAARRHYCHEELRLNRRTAPDLYLEVVPISGTPARPCVNGTGAAFEYALRMRQFPAAQELGAMLAAGAVEAAALRAFGGRMANFHETVDRSKSGHFGQPDRIQARLGANLAQIGPLLGSAETALLEPVRQWLATTAAELKELMGERAVAGMVREGHGDLHSGNLVALGDGITAFDCIEFDPALRWIDVIDDISFLFMDLLVHDRADLACAFLDSYLAGSGDYEGLALLDLYAVNRSVVRAKVAAVARASRPSGADDDSDTGNIRRHLRFAADWPHRPAPVLLLMHGLPASGKSSVAQALVEALPAIRISSDVERKRLAGLSRHAASGSAPGAGLYDRGHNEATYARLREAAATGLLSGHNVIVDAAFLNVSRREEFYALGRRLEREVVLVDCRAPLGLLEERIRIRAAGPHDSEADRDVLRYALDQEDPIRTDEGVSVLEVDTSTSPNPASVADRIRSLTGAGDHGRATGCVSGP